MEKKGIKTLIVILVLLVIVAGILLAMKIMGNNNEQTYSDGVISLGTDTGKQEEEKQVQIWLL